MAGDGFLDGPEKLDDGFRAAENDGIGVDAETLEPGAVKHAQILAVAVELSDDDGRAVGGEQHLSGGERKTQGCATYAVFVDKHLMKDTRRDSEKVGSRMNGICCSLGEQWPFFDGFDPGTEVIQRLLL